MNVFMDTFEANKVFSWEMRSYTMQSKRGEWVFEFSYRYNKQEYQLKIPTTPDGGGVLYPPQEEWISEQGFTITSEWYGYYSSYRSEHLNRVEEEILKAGGACSLRQGEVAYPIVFPLNKRVYSRMLIDYRRLYHDGSVIMSLDYDFENESKIHIKRDGDVDLEQFLIDNKYFFPSDASITVEGDSIIVQPIGISILFDLSKLIPDKRFIQEYVHLYPRGNQ